VNGANRAVEVALGDRVFFFLRMKAISMKTMVRALAFALACVHLPQVSISQSVPGAKVIISTPNSVMKTGAEIRVDVKIVNNSEGIIRAIKAVGPDGQAEASNEFTVFNEKGVRVAYHGPEQWLGRITVRLKPGESSNDFVILSKIFDLRKPGKYRVSDMWEVMVPEGEGLKGATVPSNEIFITVTK
jgi:hypothetical protein